MKGITVDNDAERYLKEIKMLLPTFGKDEKRFFSEFRTEIEDYVTSNAPLGYEEIVSRFGKPNVIVSDYIDNMDVKHIIKRIRVARIVRIGVIIIVVAAIAAASAIIAIKYVDFIKGQEQYVDREIIEVEEE
jgi:hypothetical protein